MLAGIMCLILVASVGWAWYLVRASGQKTTAAADILKDVRAKGLGSYWPAIREIDFFIVQRGGKDVEWVIEMRQPAAAAAATLLGEEMDQAGYTGLKWTSRGSEENWWVSADASKGQYIGPTGQRGQQIRISMSPEGLDVTLLRGLSIVEARQRQSLADNYLPEGMLSLAVRQVAAAGRDATFRGISNEVAFIQGQLHVGYIHMQPRGSTQVLVLHSTPPAGTAEAVYHLDSDGRVERVEMADGEVLRRASLEELRIAFAGRDPVLAGRLASLGIGTASDVGMP